MKWQEVWKWYKKPNGEYVKLKVNAVKADETLVDKGWTSLETCPNTGGYLEPSSKNSSSKKEVKKSNNK